MEAGARLAARRLPKRERVAGTSTSSGSTGAPTAVLQSERSRFAHQLLVQRQLRWYRFDPLGAMAWIRAAKDIRVPPDNRPIEDGRTLVRAAWPGLGAFFATGPFLGFSKSNPTERKVAWLEEHRPDYLLAGSGQLEHLALALQDRAPIEGLKGLRAVSEPLTKGMERRVERAFGAPVHISYGMDEVGWIATRCLEGGRYHVHTEHCLVELVDGNGDPAERDDREVGDDVLGASEGEQAQSVALLEAVIVAKPVGRAIDGLKEAHREIVMRGESLALDMPAVPFHEPVGESAANVYRQSSHGIPHLLRLCCCDSELPRFLPAPLQIIQVEFDVMGWRMAGREIFGFDLGGAVGAVVFENPAPLRIRGEGEAVAFRVEHWPMDFAGIAIVNQQSALVVLARGAQIGTASPA